MVFLYVSTNGVSWHFPRPVLWAAFVWRVECWRLVATPEFIRLSIAVIIILLRTPNVTCGAKLSGYGHLDCEILCPGRWPSNLYVLRALPEPVDKTSGVGEAFALDFTS